MQPIVPYFRPYMKPLNYHEYTKNFNPNVHVQVFKFLIKANSQTITEEITNLFNFTLRDNASDNLCNNYMKDHPNYKFVDLQHVFCKCY